MTSKKYSKKTSSKKKVSRTKKRVSSIGRKTKSDFDLAKTLGIVGASAATLSAIYGVKSGRESAARANTERQKSALEIMKFVKDNPDIAKDFIKSEKEIKKYDEYVKHKKSIWGKFQDFIGVGTEEVSKPANYDLLKHNYTWNSSK